jgi:predicted alpha/beta-fold hydrolase
MKQMTARFELVTCKANGVELHGIYASPPEGSEKLAIHVHGTWGNFYGNPFIAPLAEVYLKNGYAFLSANFPGHDETAVTENIEDFEPALQSWMSQWPRRRVLLQGHSLGAIKVLKLRKSKAWSALNVMGVVLLSPFDVTRFYEVQTKMSVSDLRSVVNKFAEEKGLDSVLPSEVFGLWPISAGVVLAGLDEGAGWNQFPSARHDMSAVKA